MDVEPDPSVLGYDEAEIEAAVSNRRRSPRYTAVRDLLWVGWWSDDEFNVVEGNLVNISQGGVMIAVNPAPPQGQPVWMRLEGTANRESLRAVVLDSRWMILKRRFAVRLAFKQACPAEFFETAVYGRSTRH